MRIVLFFMFFSFAFGLFAENNPEYAYDKIDPALLEEANSVVRLESQEYIIFARNKIVEEVIQVYTILNEKSNDEYFDLHYDIYHWRIDNLEAKLFDKNGDLIRKIKKSEILDYSSYGPSTEYTDSRSKYIEFSNRSYPYTIEIKYKRTIRYSHLAFSMNVSNNKRAIEKISMSLKVKDGIDLDFNTINSDLKPEINIDGKFKFYKWQKENVAAMTKEKYSPDLSEIYESVVVKINNFQYDEYEGSFNSWKDYGAFLYELNKERNQVSEELESKIEELVSTSKNDLEKIRILYKYVQDNTRYVSVQLGIGGHQTFDANYVDKNKFGDCKALSNYMGSLLNVAGIQSHSAVIWRGNDKVKYYDDFAIPYFNHVIQYVPSEDLWIECTSNDYPLGYMGRSNDNREVLIFSSEGGNLTYMPEFPKEENYAKSKYTIKILAEGGANIDGKKEYSGFEHERLRRWFFNGKKKEFEETFTDNFPVVISKMNEISLAANENEPTASVIYNVDVERYGSKAGKRMFIPLNPFHLKFTRFPDYKERKFDVVSKYQSIRMEDIELILPEGFDIESIPEPEKTIDSDFGTYSLSIQQTDGKILIKRSFNTKLFQLPPDRYNDLKEFYKQINTCDNAKLVLVKKKT